VDLVIPDITYLLNNKDIPIVAINGAVGSGKTFLSIRMALHHIVDKGNSSKVLAVREAIGEGKEVGYLRGTFEDKTKLFFKPIEQSLSGGEFELQALIQRGVLESTIPFYIKGTTYNDTIIVCDESEDLSKKQLKLLGTRLGQNSRIFFAGDYKQSTVDSSERNAMVMMCNELKGNKNFGCVYLDEDVRSEASKIFANLFLKQ
jgi:PhoH-like ATPase